MSIGQNAHSFVCCDLDHGSSSTPPTRATSPCPFEAYCCLDQHCSPPCDDKCEPCPEACIEPCPETCTETCSVELCPDTCAKGAECKDACTDQCEPCVDPECEPPAWCPPGCTIEEYIQRCTDQACTLPQADPLALLAQQPLNQNYFDLVAQVLGTNVQPAPPPALAHVCHWQNCHRSFETMPVLLAHIAADHLSAPGYDAPAQQAHAPAPSPPQPVAPKVQAQAPSIRAFGVPSSANAPNAAAAHDVFSCLWDDCFPFGMVDTSASTVATPSTATAHSHAPTPAHTEHNYPQVNGNGNGHSHPLLPHPHNHGHGELSPQTMLRHLLEDHLGVADLLQVNAEAHAHLVLTHTHANSHPHHPPHHTAHPHPQHGGCPTAPHDAHAHAHSHHSLVPHHHHPVDPIKLPPTPSPTPPGTSAAHICLWPGCTITEAFPSAGDLMEHLSEAHIGRGRDSYRCRWDGCGGPEGRLFSSRQKVLRHLQSHTGHRPYVCSVCAQTFSEAAPLAAHMRRHADDKPFVCDHPGCGKAFAISSSLTIHKRTHNGDRPFVCPHCGKGFVEASNLTKHIRTHTGERPFACSHPGCGRRFSRPDQLKRHALVHDAAHKGRLAAKAKA